MDHSVCVSRA